VKATAVLGCRVRSGRAAAVLLAYPADNCRLLDSREFSLADPDDPSTIQPYHADFGTLEVDQSRIAPRLHAVTQAAQASVKKALAAWQSRRLQVTVAALVVGSLTDPHTIKHPHMRAHGLEGQLFRTVLADALRSAGISSTFFSDRDIYQRAAAALGLSTQALRQLISALRDADKPWSADHRLAVAGALVTSSSNAAAIA
jgi:hypothetical protein